MVSNDLNLTRERRAATIPGGLMLLVFFALVAWIAFSIFKLVTTGDEDRFIAPLIGGAVTLALVWAGFYSLQPNEGAAVMLFGAYKGTDRASGLRWLPFWYTRKKISLRARNVTSETLKVNDKRGSPIEIGAVVVWRVADSAQALFDVDAYVPFVDIQIETALREIASHFAYDHTEDATEPTLRSDADQVSALLMAKLQDRVGIAGVVVDEARLSHLAYAPEIASAMLRRQQADAVLAAREKIVRGAVEMVQHALDDLSKRGIVKLDDERRAAMVSNLLVVLCSDRDAQPVVNTGTLYT